MKKAMKAMKTAAATDAAPAMKTAAATDVAPAKKAMKAMKKAAVTDAAPAVKKKAMKAMKDTKATKAMKAMEAMKALIKAREDQQVDRFWQRIEPRWAAKVAAARASGHALPDFSDWHAERARLQGVTGNLWKDFQ